MKHSNTRDPLRRLTALCVLLITLILAFPAAASASEPAALTDVNVTISQTSGAKPTRFTFTANTAAPIETLTITFPEGFSLDEIRVDVVTLDGLKRTALDVEQEVSGQDVQLAFEPAMASDSSVRVQLWNVRLPREGGTHTLTATYLSQGAEGQVETPSFEFSTVTRTEEITAWLEEQAWVDSWNRVKFFNIFVRPQVFVVAVPALFKGWLMSMGLVAIAFPIAIFGGLALAFMKMAKFWPIRFVANIYINVIRGTPLFLQIYIAFVGLPIAGIRAPLFVAGVAVLALNSSAYLAEIFRAGIQSIHKGQFEAASSLGMTYPQSMMYVIVPQTIKRVLPTMTSEFILLFKDTALLSAVGVFELMLYSRSLATRGGNLTPFVVAALYYLVVTIPLINWVSSLEKRLAVSEHGQSPDDTKKHGSGLFGRLLGRSEMTQPVLAEECIPGCTPEEHQSR